MKIFILDTIRIVIGLAMFLFGSLFIEGDKTTYFFGVLACLLMSLDCKLERLK